MACNHRCNQGRACTCAIAAFYAETEGVMPMATGCSTKAVPLNAGQLITDNSDGSDPNKPAPAHRLTHLGRWALLTLAIMAAAAVTAGFFTK